MLYDLESVTRELTLIFKSAVVVKLYPVVRNECRVLLSDAIISK